MQSSSAQAEMLYDVKDFLRLLNVAELILFGDDQVDVDVGVNNLRNKKNRIVQLNLAQLLTVPIG